VSNPTDLPHFKEWLGYSMTYNGVPFQNGNALHKHNSVEVFVALDGDFEIGYACGKTDSADEKTSSAPSLKDVQGKCHAAVLEQFDLVACPAGVYHYYKNVDPTKKDKQILTILPGRPTVHWAPQVVDDAREKGANCDDKGVLRLNGKDKPMHAPHIDEIVLDDGEMDPFVTRYADYANPKGMEHQEGSTPVKYAVHLADPEDTAKFLKIGYHIMQSHASTDRQDSLRLSAGGIGEDAGSDMLVIVLKGSVQVKGIGKNVQGFQETLEKLEMMKLPSSEEFFEFTSSASDSTLLLVRSTLPHTFEYFFDPHKELMKERQQDEDVSSTTADSKSTESD
jgi:hypothetical protein